MYVVCMHAPVYEDTYTRPIARVRASQRRCSLYCLFDLKKFVLKQFYKMLVIRFKQRSTHMHSLCAV